MKTHSSFPQYLDVNNLYAWAMCQKLPVKNFNWCKDLRYVNQKFLKIMMKILLKKNICLK